MISYLPNSLRQIEMYRNGTLSRLDETTEPCYKAAAHRELVEFVFIERPFFDRSWRIRMPANCGPFQGFGSGLGRDWIGLYISWKFAIGTYDNSNLLYVCFNLNDSITSLFMTNIKLISKIERASRFKYRIYKWKSVFLCIQNGN